MSHPVDDESEVDFDDLMVEAGRIFTPNAPIAEKTLFAGRIAQVQAVLDSIYQTGLHAVLYGERGVGKTSLANVIEKFVKGAVTTVVKRVNCASGDSYSALWKRMFSEIAWTHETPMMGITQRVAESIRTLADNAPDILTIDDVRQRVTSVSGMIRVVFIFDEFDTLRSAETRAAMAETVKLFSDFAVNCTLIFVGVADSIDGLLSDHRSVDRALVQVQMPRMSQGEIKEILMKGSRALGMDFSSVSLNRVLQISRGLPHYAHLLGLHAVRAALEAQEMVVQKDHVVQAIEEALTGSHHSIITSYNSAIFSPRKHNLYREVLLACALAPTDELGWFAPNAVRAPLNEIVSPKNYDVANYIRHLNAFAERSHGEVLERAGDSHRFKFRFKDPLLQPYVVLLGHKERRLHWNDSLDGATAGQ